jgi:hypothetical protein
VICSPCCSYFEQSSSESEDEGGETEEAIKQRIAKEFGFGGTKGDSSEEEEEEEGKEEGEDDPLEAFMAGIEV